MSINLSKILELRDKILKNIIETTIERFEKLSELAKENPKMAKSMEKELINSLKQLHGVLSYMHSMKMSTLGETPMSTIFKPLEGLLKQFVKKYFWLVRKLRQSGIASSELENLAKSIVEKLQSLGIEMHGGEMRHILKA